MIQVNCKKANGKCNKCKFNKVCYKKTILEIIKNKIKRNKKNEY